MFLNIGIILFYILYFILQFKKPILGDLRSPTGVSSLIMFIIFSKCTSTSILTWKHVNECTEEEGTGGLHVQGTLSGITYPPCLKDDFSVWLFM